jgi:hypothetical protein
MTNTYISPVYGKGEIIARYNGEIVVRFDNPPGMKVQDGPRIVPIIHYLEAKK